MHPFTKLRSLRLHQRVHMPYLESLEDYDLVCAIGDAQEAGLPCTTALLLTYQLGTEVTIRRRLARLIRLSIVVRRADKEDGRKVLLQLSQKTIAAYAKLDSLIDNG